MRRQLPDKAKAPEKKQLWILAGSVLLALLMALILQMSRMPPKTPTPQPVFPPDSVITAPVWDILNQHGLTAQTVSRERHFWTVSVPSGLPIPSLHLEIRDGVTQAGARIVRAVSDPARGHVTLGIGWKDSIRFQLQLIPRETDAPVKGQIALIIDDFGDRWDETHQAFLSLGIPVTCSVMPGRRFSKQSAETMAQAGFEVIVHLPMEPVKGRYPKDGYTIISDMTSKAIRRKTRLALASLPQAVGLNNHMGSKVTARRESIVPVIAELQTQGFYFVDSRTTAQTVAYRVAGELGVPRTQRDVFIDNDMTDDLIRRRLWELARKAEKEGVAVGIGHCRKLTLAVLQDEVQKLLARGYRFVPVSQVVERPGG